MVRLIPVVFTIAALTACGGGSSSGEGGSSGPTVVQDKGSDTMVNLMQRLSEEYSMTNPKIVVAVTGGGTGTGVKSLIDGTTDIANASRKLSEKELALAKQNGKNPVETVVAYDGLSIYVHKDNPIQQISFEELRCIYAADGTCNNWKDLGITLDCGGNDNIVKLGRQNNSGTYEYFREEIIGGDGKFTNTMDQSGTQQVVDVIGTQKCAIGYGGMGYQKEGVRHVCLSKVKGEPCVEPTLEAVKAGTYVFARPLQVYTNGEPQGATKEFLDFVLSPAGQKIVVEAGFVDVKK